MTPKAQPKTASASQNPREYCSHCGIALDAGGGCGVCKPRKTQRKAPEESAHTPGPWILKESGSGMYDLMDTRYNNWIATIHGGYDNVNQGDESDEADARLIAAAPELLEAAKAALTGLDASGQSLLASDVRAAIAKAEKGAQS